MQRVSHSRGQSAVALARQQATLAPVPGTGIVQGIDYRPLQTRPSITGWTPDLIRMVGDQADSGVFLGLGDLVEAMLSDDRISGVLQSIALNMLGLPIHFKGGDDTLRTALEDGEWDAMHPESELVKLLVWGVMMGVCPAQRIPLPRVPGQPQRYRLKTWHPRWLSYDFMAVSGAHWRISTREGIKRIVRGGQWVLFEPFGSERPWIDGKWRSCAFPWIVKHFALEDRANQAEVVGSPTLVGKSPQGSTERQRQRFIAELRALGRNGRIVLPPEWDLDLIESTGDMTAIFSESTNWADQAITIILASQTATTEGSPGFDSGKTQDQILSGVTRYYAKSLASCLNAQSLQPTALMNTGSRADAPCAYWNVERLNAQASLATTMQTISTAGPALDAWLDRHGMAVDAAALTNTFGVPVMSNKGLPPPPAPKAPTFGASATTGDEPPPPGQKKTPLPGAKDKK